MATIDTADWKPRVDAEMTKLNAEIVATERALAELRIQRQSLLGAYNLLLVAEAGDAAPASDESAADEPITETTEKND